MTITAQPGYIIDALLSASDDLVNPLGVVFDLWNNDHDALAGCILKNLLERHELYDVHAGVQRLLYSDDSRVMHLNVPTGEGITDLFKQFLSENGVAVAVT